MLYSPTFTQKNQPNVGKYTIHGWYGYYCQYMDDALPEDTQRWMIVLFLEEAPDILSHCAVRARNFGVLLCTCTLADGKSQELVC